MGGAATVSLGFNTVTKDWRNISRQLCCSGLGKPARAAIRGSGCGIYKSLAGSAFQTSPLQLLNEIFYSFNQPLHFCRFNILALECSRPNGTRGPFPGAAGKISDGTGPSLLPAGELAENDLDLWAVRELPGER